MSLSSVFSTVREVPDVPEVEEVVFELGREETSQKR